MVPRPPIRAFSLSAGLAVAGAVLAVLADLWGPSTALVLVGFGLIAAGLGLALFAQLATRGMRVRVNLDEEGFRVEDGGPPHTGAWRDITRVTRSEGRITLHEGAGKRTHLVVPTGGSADLDALGADIARRLDASRGYRPYRGDED